MEGKSKIIVYGILAIVAIVLVLKFIAAFWWTLVVAAVFFYLGYSYTKKRKKAKED
jgi:predicted PurR-regulated permease PerM